MKEEERFQCPSTCHIERENEKTPFKWFPNLCFGHYMMIAGIVYILILQLFFV